MEVELPRIHIGQNILLDFEKAIQMEWIVTNGLGGYSSSTTIGINTRKFHGLLVAAFNPPTDRRVLLTKLDEEIQIGDKVYETGANDFKRDVQPKGYQFLLEFSLNPFPIYMYDVGGVQIQKTIFMPYGENATIVGYEILNPHKEKVFVRASPLVNSRHFYTTTNKDKSAWDFIQKPFEHGVIVQPSIPTSTLIISSDSQFLMEKGEWIRRTYFRVDDSRGESCFDDAFQPGKFELVVSPEEKRKFCVLATAGINEKEAHSVFSSIYPELGDFNVLLNKELKRRKELLAKFQERYMDVKMEDWLKWLVLATDSFIVNRMSTKTKSVIAGYHWFEDWGRDSLISLPGLTLITGRFEDAKEILLTFKHYCQKGIIPSRFPDLAGDMPEYNTVDAILWYINAVLQYIKYTGDFNFVYKELWELLKSIIENHVKGTLYQIHVDEDGLLSHGPQLTWMDAMVNDKFVTPREGKAVEIQALWYNALRTMELLATHFKQTEEAKKYSALAEKARRSFLKKFWNPQKGYLFDTVCEEEGDPSLRPNQVIAVALDFHILNEARGEKVVETVWKKLWGTYGLKTLPEDDKRYVGKYVGDWNQRNNAYHNGTVWAWLLGPFTTAFLKLKNYEEKWRTFAFQNFLQPLFSKEVFQAGLGTISEIFDGDSPHMPRGCIAQAWSVAEPLRAFVEDVMLKRPPHEHILRRFLWG